MSPKQFRAVLAELKLNQRQAAEFLGRDLRTIQRYAAGEPIPEPVAKLLTILKEQSK